MNNLNEEGTFAIRFGFVGSGTEYKKVYYYVGGKGDEAISSPPVLEFCLPYDDYKVYRH